MDSYIVLKKEMRSMFFDDTDHSIFKELLSYRDTGQLSEMSYTFNDIFELKHTKESLGLSADLTDTMLFYFLETQRHDSPLFTEKLIDVVNEHNDIAVLQKWWPCLSDDERIQLLSTVRGGLLRKILEEDITIHAYIPQIHPHAILRCLPYLKSTREGEMYAAFVERVKTEELYKYAGSWDLFLRVPFFDKENQEEWIPCVRQCGIPLLVNNWLDFIKKTDEHHYFPIIQESLTEMMIKHSRFELKNVFNDLETPIHIKYLLKFKIPEIDKTFNLPEDIHKKWMLQEELGIPFTLDDSSVIPEKNEGVVFL